MIAHPDKINKIKDTIKEMRCCIKQMEKKNDQKIKSLLTSVYTKENDKEKGNDYQNKVQYTTQMTISEQLMPTNENYNDNNDIEESEASYRKYNCTESLDTSKRHPSPSPSQSQEFTYQITKPELYTNSSHIRSKSKLKSHKKSQYVDTNTNSQESITTRNQKINYNDQSASSFFQTNTTYDYSTKDVTKLRSYLQQLKDQNYLIAKNLRDTKIENEALTHNESNIKLYNDIKSLLNEKTFNNVIKRINELKDNENQNKIRDELIIKIKSLYQLLTNTNKESNVNIKTIWKWINHLVKTVKEMYNEKERKEDIMDDLNDAEMYKDYCIQLINDYHLNNILELKGFINTLLAKNNICSKRIHKLKKVLLSCITII